MISRHFCQISKCEKEFVTRFHEIYGQRLWRKILNFHIVRTGCFIWKVEISNGCSSVMVHIWPNVGKAKMCLRGGRFFQFSKICLHFSAVCLQFFKKSATSQTHFGFTNIGSNMHRYKVTAIWNFHFSNETPCNLNCVFARCNHFWAL